MLGKTTVEFAALGAAATAVAAAMTDPGFHRFLGSWITWAILLPVMLSAWIAHLKTPWPDHPESHKVFAAIATPLLFLTLPMVALGGACLAFITAFHTGRITTFRSMQLVSAVFFGLLVELYLLLGLLGEGAARPLPGLIAGVAGLAVGVALTARELVRSMRIGVVMGVEIEAGGWTRLGLAGGVLSAPFIAGLLSTAGYLPTRGAAEAGLTATSLLIWLLGARSAPRSERVVSMREPGGPGFDPVDLPVIVGLVAGLAWVGLSAWSAIRAGRW